MIVKRLVQGLYLLSGLVAIANHYGYLHWVGEPFNKIPSPDDELSMLEKAEILLLVVAIISSLFRGLFSLQWSLSSLTFILFYQVNNSLKDMDFGTLDNRAKASICLLTSHLGLGLLFGVLKQCEHGAGRVSYRLENRNGHDQHPPPSPSESNQMIQVFDPDNMLTSTVNIAQRKNSSCSVYFKAEDRDEFYPKHQVGQRVNSIY